jgi:hypothetical protein
LFLCEFADGNWVRFIGIFAWLLLVGALSAATLGNPRRVGTDFEFSIAGASNAIYAVQASSDLTNWTTVATNRQFGEVRTIQISSSAQQEFYRVRPLQPLFTAALAVHESIEFAGSGVTVVSFDSRDPRYFNPDGTLDPGRFSDGGDITTNSGLTNSLNLANAKVYGVVRAPRDGVVLLGPGGSVGSIVWHLIGNIGIEPGWYVEGTPRVFVDPELPTGVYVTPGPGVVGGTNYTYVLSTGHYRLAALNLGSGQTMLVTGRATLHVSTAFHVTGKIVILRDAGLDLYVGAADSALHVSQMVNESRNAAAFAYYGLRNNLNLSLGGIGSFAGTIYAPAAGVHVGGGGNDELDFIGAVVGRNVTVNGKLNVHYDEALAIAGPAL